MNNISIGLVFFGVLHSMGTLAQNNNIGQINIEGVVPGT